MRLFNEYGAVFVSGATPPPCIIFEDEEEVDRFQATLESGRARIGEFEIELQREAMDALLAAAAEIALEGGTLTPRASDSGRRSFADTVGLWNRNVTRGLDHWLELGRITSDQAHRIRDLNSVEQVGVILELEDSEHIYFGTFFDKSILYSVAAPGASQHLSMLAFDLFEFQERAAELALNHNGWFRTVAYDFPHFTYLGHHESVLPALGLKTITRTYNNYEYLFWVPDPDRF
jgi:hypothetical protein